MWERMRETGCHGGSSLCRRWKEVGVDDVASGEISLQLETMAKDDVLGACMMKGETRGPLSPFHFKMEGEMSADPRNTGKANEISTNLSRR